MLTGNNLIGRSLSCNCAWCQQKPRKSTAGAVVSCYTCRQWNLWGLRKKPHQDLAASYENQAVSDFPSMWLKVPWHSGELSWILQLRDAIKPVICYIYKIFNALKSALSIITNLHQSRWYDATRITYLPPQARWGLGYLWSSSSAHEPPPEHYWDTLM